ncbi:alpha-tocopherol transfer protein-like [Diaphorina citri]|uniref:Alpha-tocopherol transfer protein-like n=1 Tax=Diaphorina citri TaxID=121845 RepID=A0A1S3D0T3_DIACI|nr:alpha-tocopherol transfer protein-like [Diaphorina citri]
MTLVQPTAEQSIHIRKELNEDENSRDKDLEHIKEWLKRQPHLPQFNGKGQLERGGIGSNVNPICLSSMFLGLKNICILVHNSTPMPGLTPNGRRVIIMRASDLDQVLSADAATGMKLVLMIGDIRLKEESVGVAGDVYVFDAAIATPQNFAAHIAKFTPTLIKKFLICVQEAYPVKLKEIHIINASGIVDTIINLVKPFIKEKIRNRIVVHADMESLYKSIPKDVLPEEYGGYAGDIKTINEQWMKKIESYRDWFKEQETVKADEAKRPGKPKTHDDLFGMEGSFKQLSID